MTARAAQYGDDDLLRIAAISHSDGGKIDQSILQIVRRLRRRDYRLAGAVRARMVPPAEDRCDLYLEDLATSAVVSMSLDLGTGSDACRLDDAALDQIAANIEGSLQDGIDILILNKFGKQEAEGRGLRGPIAKAVELGIPVLVGLNAARLQSWCEFCGTTDTVFDTDDTAIDHWLAANLATPSQAQRTQSGASLEGLK